MAKPWPERPASAASKSEAPEVGQKMLKPSSILMTSAVCQRAASLIMQQRSCAAGPFARQG